MEIEQGQSATMVFRLQVAMCRDCPAAFFQRNGQFDVMRVREWKTTYDCVAIAAKSQSDIGLKHAVLQSKCVSQPVNLTMVPGSRNAVIDFLHEDNIGLVMGKRLRDPLWAIASVDSSDTLVYVVGD